MKLLPVIIFYLITLGAAKEGFKNGNQEWDFTEVRPGAKIFWWFYYTTATGNYTERPLIIWLQGGPGFSSTGLGNFLQFGPFDQNLKERKSTLIKQYNILYIDSPVGSGFSYVNDNDLLAKNEDEIVHDLNATLVDFLNKFPEFKTTPLYIFGETYGAKMAVDFAFMLDRDIHNEHKRVEANLKGVALGDPWISPIDAVKQWGPFLLKNGLIDEAGSKSIMDIANSAQEAIDKNDWKSATTYYDQIVDKVEELSNDIDFFNIKKNLDIGELELIMNIEVSVALNLPLEAEWKQMNIDVFNALELNLMQSATLSVQALLELSELKVAIYNSEYDLYVDKEATLSWINKLTGDKYEEWNNAPEVQLKDDKNNVYGLVKKSSRLATYSIDGVGNMIGADKPEAMITLYDDIINKF